MAMTRTHAGCKIKVRAGRRASWGRMVATVNGEHFPTAEQMDEPKAIAEIVRHLDHVHASPVDGSRHPGSYYAPGTYEMCDEGHPRALGEECVHPYCAG